MFGRRESLELEGWIIERAEVKEKRSDGDGYFNSKAYSFRKAPQ
jgi:hypothetical protein